MVVVIDAAVAGNIIAGASLGFSASNTAITSLLSTMAYSVALAVEIENYTKWNLVNPQVYMHYGGLRIPPGPVASGTKEAMTAHKTYITAGTSGVVSWDLDNGRGAKVYMMWSMPYNFNHHVNTMGIGISRYGSTPNEGLFDRMYYDGLYKRGEYYYTAETITYQCSVSGIIIKGNMGTVHKATAKLQIIPIDEADLMPMPKK